MTGYVSAPSSVELPSLLPAAVLVGTDGARPGRSRTLRDWLVDVVAFQLCVAAGILLVGSEQSSDSPMPLPLLVADVVVGSAVCLALWWRRRWPVAIAVFAVTVGGLSTMSALATTAMIFTVAVHRRSMVAFGVAALGFVTMLPYWALHHQPHEAIWMEVVLSVVVTAAALGWGMLARARRQLIGSWRDRAQRAEAEQQLRVDQARRMERARIAREMHDVLAHRISLLSVHAGALEFRADAGREQLQAAAGVIRANAHQALQDLREVIGVLREDDAAAGGDDTVSHAAVPERPQPGLAEIPALIAESTDAGATVHYSCVVPGDAGVPGNIARTVYRVVQEGLTNARKHAPGVPIDVVLAGSPGDDLLVKIVNRTAEGSPVSTVPGAGLGLIGLAERVQLSGGRLSSGPDLSDRFVLLARLPWPR